jgi:phosphoribosylamine--glycine ligase
MEGLINEGSPYLGFLYAGLMIDGEDIKDLEFNCRFGDPETQPIMMRLKSSLTNLCIDAIEGNLDNHKADWDERHACGVVIASEGYPENYAKNKEISFQALNNENMKIFHAGTKKDGEKILTSGGRVLCATALGKDLKEAQKLSYNAVKSISFEGAFFRKDIGHKGFK